MSIVLRRMQSADVPLGMHLTTQAGWNQIPADWERMLRLEPDGCFVAEYAGAPVGTSVCCTFGPVAWLALVLVDEPFRRLGLGRALLHTALDYADRSGVETVRLDATPLGRPIYERLGFVPQFELTRWGGVPIVDAESLETVDCEFVSKAFLAELIRLDQRATRTDRSKLLQLLLEDGNLCCTSREHSRIEREALSGMMLCRPGRVAMQIGPCSATGVVSEKLFAAALARLAGQPVFVDIPVDNVRLSSTADHAGLSRLRVLTRMCRGRPLLEDPEWFQISSGPELG